MQLDAPPVKAKSSTTYRGSKTISKTIHLSIAYRLAGHRYPHLRTAILIAEIPTVTIDTRKTFAQPIKREIITNGGDDVKLASNSQASYLKTPKRYAVIFPCLQHIFDQIAA